MLLLAVVLIIPKGFGSVVTAYLERHRGRRSAPPLAPDAKRLAAAIHKPETLA